MCPETDIRATVTPIGVNVGITVNMSSGQILSPLGGDVFRGLQTGSQKCFLYNLSLM